MFFVVYHDSNETMGLMDSLLKEFNISFQEVHAYKGMSLPIPSQVEGLLLMGGPMSVHDDKTHPFLKAELDLISTLLAQKVPILGICLGAQLLAKALGARVYAAREKEIGFLPVHLTSAAATDPLFKGFDREMTVFQWHGDNCDLPTSAVRLAESPVCSNQAFRWRDRAYGLQFHLEVEEDMIRQWATTKDGRDFMKGTQTTSDFLLDQMKNQLAPVQRLGRTVGARFINHCLKGKISAGEVR